MNLRRRALTLARLGYDLGRAAFWPVAMGVRVMLIKEGCVLLVYHSYASSWHFPGGGLKRGESLLDAARRESHEEAGAILTGELSLLGVYIGRTRGRTDHTAVFVCEEFDLLPPTDRWEIIGRGFFGLDRLPPDAMRGVRQCVAQYQGGGDLVIGLW